MSERYTLEQFERDKAKREEEARKESEQQQERVTRRTRKGCGLATAVRIAPSRQRGCAPGP
jgi:hypothetical protein